MSIATQRLSQDVKTQHQSQLNMHIRETASPETYPGVVLAPPSSRDVQFQLVAKFEVDRKNRPNKDMIPCSICSPNDEKCLKGWLAYFPEDGKFRLVGPTCGKNDLDNFGAEEREYRREQELMRRRDFVQHNIDIVSETIEQIPNFRRKALAAVGFRRKLRQKLPEIYQQFEVAAARADKGLTIRQIIKRSEYQNNLSRKSGEEFVDIVIATLHGASIFDRSFKPSWHVGQATKLLDEYSISCARSFLRSGDEDIPDYPKKWRQALEHLRKAKGQIEATRSFLTEHNFQGLNNWGQHEENPIPFQASWEKGHTYMSDGSGELQGEVTKQLKHSCPEIAKLP